MAKIVAGAALIAGAVALDVFTAGAATTLTPFEVAALGAVAGAAGSVGGTLLMSGIAQAMHLGDTGQQGVLSRRSYRPWQIVYGRQRVSGITVDMSLSDGGNGDNRWLWDVQALAAHPILAIDATYLNQQQAFCNREVTGGVNGLVGNLIGTNSTDGGDMTVNGLVQSIHPTDLNFREYSNFFWDGNPRFWMAQYDGTQVAADPFYMALCATNPTTALPHWDSTCILEGLAYSLNRYWSNSHWVAGVPVVQYDVRGKNNIWDPRSSTYGYTENAALVLADYMCNQQWGMMFSYADFDADTLIAAANICDEVVTLTNPLLVNTVTSTTEPRYYINATTSTGQSGGMVIEQMLAAMAGKISYIGGLWFIFPGVWQGTSGTSITRADTLDSFTWSATRKSRELFNEVRGLFMCASGWNTTYAPGFDVYNVTAQQAEDNFNGQWQMADMPPFCLNSLRGYASDTYLTEDGGVKYLKNVTYPYTISSAYAQRLSKILLLRNRWQGTGSVRLPIQFLGIQPNDVIQITDERFGWSAKYLEVQSTNISLGSVDSQGNFIPPSITINFAEVDPSIYAWLATDELPLQGGQNVAGSTSYDPAPVTGLTLTSGNVTLNTSSGSVFAHGVIVATWTASADAMVTDGGQYLIQFQEVGASSWTDFGYVGGTATECTINTVSSGLSYLVQVSAIRYSGEMSSSVQSGPITASDSSISVSSTDLTLPASPSFTAPTATTAAPLTNNTQVATTAYADAAVAVEKTRAEAAEALLAPQASAALTGTPTAPTAAALTNSTQLATTAYADSAVSVEKARALAAEALLAPKASPTFTGSVTAPIFVGSEAISFSAGAAAGTGASVAPATGYNTTATSGAFVLNTGSGSTAAGIMVNASFAALPNFPSMVFFSGGNGGATPPDISTYQPYVDGGSKTAWAFSLGVAPPPNTSFVIYYICTN